MHFQLRYITADFDFGDAQISIVDNVKEMHFLLRKRVRDDAASPVEVDDGVVIVTCEREVPDALSSDAASGKPVTTSVREVADARHGMYDHMMRMLRLVRWRANSKSRPNQLRGLPDLSWSFDGSQWQPVVRIAVSGVWAFGSVPTRWTSEAEEFMRKESSNALDEPLGHELLREAWANQGENPRSSVVLAVAAAEVGFKQFVSKTYSENGWFLSRTFQSKPLLEMIAKFPWSDLRLRINEKIPSIPESILNELRDGIHLRNLIVHTGVAKLEGETAGPVLTAVRELLYFLDAVRTHQSWPLNYIGREALKELRS
jgi:hypothetical protein